MKAEKLQDEDWNVDLDWHAKPMFPFVTTCLVIGASVDLANGMISNATPLQWNMEFDRGDNNDGVTILDISQPKSVRYCFVVFGRYVYEATESDEGDEEPNKYKGVMTPLRGAEYLGIYYKEKKWTSEMKASVASLDRVSLIPVSALNEAWPRPNWSSRVEIGLEPAADDQHTAAMNSGLSNLTLTNMAMIKSIERVLDEEDELLEFVEELPVFLPGLKDY